MILRVLPDLLAFGIGLGLAYFLDWETRDLVWSLWLSSLVLGYLTFLSAMGGAALVGLSAMRRKGLGKTVVVGIGGGLFCLGFFSIHFGGFHAGHSLFLQHFFPLGGVADGVFGEAVINPPLPWALAFWQLVMPYGLFLIPAIIAERRHVFLSLSRAVQSVRGSATPDLSVADETARRREQISRLLVGALFRPYVNVARMHLLIFFFAASHWLAIDSFLVYAVVFSVYFFPWAGIPRQKALVGAGVADT